ncbi:MAG: anaerobic ribonucleoside-triphosphate reductase activating protein [bacterium (Candidatus Ratteibacteria) CG_4_10_14_3_um_filter_41_18]|uniref:Anaerobic ribonucleoside-triphosphate reductase activating protein n=4 Tax=Candidatus Ratteibacteria TaxID=2979319 RepID=A0A2M7YHI0_9BACT|nr:MAG: anaerobic ribonucleoside-triphosphate reductase activating protein [Candidatus Omnitrophica bacterium CG1_02_41_171]PIV63609.1 MAG: anaerobic ribonucleoside-triphosphate reductase activating protein [bacterium (Candidatus Ratteibacteria) CG01_land_8_20_14_3_00_40_19]PIW31994.1 MAG: anaerobic ribonucleoside-triphosphate reductase activating protein [bacterium (Candidatus Ratteibacteria) CG15_BIG_FIL_POST_REV_8_21_14_020_41_12]PIW73731.1 MAG: anaerobic ribonucleoside-triphosphate reductase
MKIGGLQKFSLIDYPGKICAIVFTQGCNFLCPYCHNPELVKPKLFSQLIPEDEIFSFLKKRKGQLEAVTVTGGEPCLQNGLSEFLQKIKEMGYLVKLDTNGSFPELLSEIIRQSLIDYLAIDVKGPLEKYETIAGVPFATEKIVKSIKIAISSKISYEFRTTVIKSLLDKDDLRKIGELIEGTHLYVLQKFVPSKLLNPSKFLKERNYSEEEFDLFKQMMLNYAEDCVIR